MKGFKFDPLRIKVMSISKLGRRGLLRVLFLDSLYLYLLVWLKLVLGISIVKVLTQFPVGVLGVLLLFAGIELAMCSRDMNAKEEAFVLLVCTSGNCQGLESSCRLYHDSDVISLV